MCLIIMKRENVNLWTMNGMNEAVWLVSNNLLKHHRNEIYQDFLSLNVKTETGVL